MERKIIPNVSVDCLVFGFDFDRLHVLLNKRELRSKETGAVLISDYTLAGHHVREGENADEAAYRILKRITGFENIYLEQFYCFSNTDRFQEKDKLWIKSLNMDIADHVFSIGYFALVDKRELQLDEEHQNACWFPVDDLPELGFDHAKIIEKGIESLRRKFKEEPIGFELLPEKFTLTQLQKLYEAVSGKEIDRRNFRKKVIQFPHIIPLNEKQTGMGTKPAQVYIFSRDVYDRTRKEKMIFA
jgi:hypothetical protein